MRFIIKVIFIAAMVYFGGPHFGWWWIAISAFLGGAIIKSTGFQSFFAGIFGVGLVWLWMVLKIDIATGSILTQKIADMFNLGHEGFIIGISVFLGALVGAISCWTGHNFRKLFESRKRGYYR
jgi:hypothetical protein